MSDVMTSEVVDGIIELMRLPAYKTIPEALWEFIDRKGLLKNHEPNKVVTGEIKTVQAFMILNPNLSGENCTAFAALVHNADDISIALMAVQNAIEFED